MRDRPIRKLPMCTIRDPESSLYHCTSELWDVVAISQQLNKHLSYLIDKGNMSE
jgi:hypothetical protein